MYIKIEMVLADKKKYSSVIVAILLLLYPLLYTYGWGFFSFGFLFAIFLMVKFWFQNGCLCLNYPKSLFLYVGYFLVARMVYATSLTTFIAPSTTSMIIVLGFFLFCLKNIDLNIFLKLYRLIAFVCIAFWLFQEFMYYTAGFRISGVITSLPLTLGGVDGVDVDVWKEANMNSVRSSSFFSESAYFAQFMLPLLALEVFYVSNRKSYFRAIIMVIVLVALQSGNALFGLVVFILCFIKYVYSKMNIIVFVCFIFSISLVGLIASPLLLKTEQGEKLMLRQEQLESDQNKNSSGFLRIWRGYFVYTSLNAKEQLFGLNNKEILKRRIASSPVSFTFKSENDLYFNAIHSILLQTGMIGLILFFIFIIWLWRGNNLTGKCVLLTLCILCGMESILFTHTMLLYLVISLLMKKRNNDYKMVRIKI